MNTRLLIDGIVRQPMVLLAQLSTAAGVRAPSRTWPTRCSSRSPGRSRRRVWGARWPRTCSASPYAATSEAVVPPVEAPVLARTANAPLVAVPAGPWADVLPRGNGLYEDAEGKHTDWFASTLDGWRDWSLTDGRDRRLYVNVTAELPAGAFFAPVQESQFWQAVQMAPGNFPMRMTVGTDGTVFGIHHCGGELVRPAVGLLCFSRPPKIGSFADGGLADSYGEVIRFQLGEGYLGYEEESPLPHSLFADITLDEDGSV